MSSRMKAAGFFAPVGNGISIWAPICFSSDALSKKIVSPQVSATATRKQRPRSALGARASPVTKPGSSALYQDICSIGYTAVRDDRPMPVASKTQYKFGFGIAVGVAIALVLSGQILL